MRYYSAVVSREQSIKVTFAVSDAYKYPSTALLRRFAIKSAEDMDWDVSELAVDCIEKLDSEPEYLCGEF